MLRFNQSPAHEVQLHRRESSHDVEGVRIVLAKRPPATAIMSKSYMTAADDVMTYDKAYAISPDQTTGKRTKRSVA